MKSLLVRRPFTLVASVAVALGVFASLVLTTPAQAKTTCPNSFHVLHNDQIGDLKLAADYYLITVSDERALSCSSAATLFARFLQDFDGNLGGGWKVKAGQSAFKRNDGVSFSVKPRGSEGPGGGNSPAKGDTVCNGSFRVQHDDVIGALSLPMDDYRIIVLKGSKLSCGRASKLFGRFLDYPSGQLPAPWQLKTGTATFTKGKNGFRVERS